MPVARTLSHCSNRLGNAGGDERYRTGSLSVEECEQLAATEGTSAKENKNKGPEDASAKRGSGLATVGK